MARKRPRLIPIKDSVVDKALGRRKRNFWEYLRGALTPEVRSQLESIYTRARNGPSDVPNHLSELRVLDIAIWMPMHGK
jgi:Family of unknown function (DUF6308)